MIKCWDVNFVQRLSHAIVTLLLIPGRNAWEYTPKDAVNHVKPVIDS